jgi:hypothetical protein
MLRVCSTLFLTTFMGGQAQAFTCLLEVGGVVFADGTCEYDEDSDGSFRFFDDSNPRMFVYVTMNGTDTALGYWPGPLGGTHAHNNLGTLRRDGACWTNEQVAVCAWR